MVAYTEFKDYERKENEKDNRESKNYGLDLFVKECLNASSNYNARSGKDGFYLKNRKNKEQRKYGVKEEKVDPLELLASIPSLRSCGCGDIGSYNSNRFGNESYGSVNSSYAKAGDYSCGESYSLGRGIAGDYSGNGESYAAAESYS